MHTLLKLQTCWLQLGLKAIRHIHTHTYIYIYMFFVLFFLGGGAENVFFIGADGSRSVLKLKNSCSKAARTSAIAFLVRMGPLGLAPSIIFRIFLRIDYYNYCVLGFLVAKCLP